MCMHVYMYMYVDVDTLHLDTDSISNLSEEKAETFNGKSLDVGSLRRREKVRVQTVSNKIISHSE